MTKDIILEFVKQINNHDTEGIAKLLSDDHTFIDAYGNSVAGKEEMKKAWEVYFEWFPDYVISITEIISGSDSIAVLGHASGTYRNQKDERNSFYWRLPAAWKVLVENDKIKIWQVYCDTKIPSQIMERNLAAQPLNENRQSSQQQQQHPPQPEAKKPFYK